VVHTQRATVFCRRYYTNLQHLIAENIKTRCRTYQTEYPYVHNFEQIFQSPQPYYFSMKW